MSALARGFDVTAARRALGRCDPQLAAWMRRIGPIGPDPRWSRSFDLVDALARSVLYQQLSGKAAATIVGRVEAACAGKRLTARALDRVDDASLRACGVSQNKLLSLRDLSCRALARQLPSARALDGLEDEAIIASLVEVRGIGRWTVEMLLIFRLGRADVFPMDDLGIRKGLARLRAQDTLHRPKEALAEAAIWAPWRSLASLYLWRIADAA